MVANLHRPPADFVVWVRIGARDERFHVFLPEVVAGQLLTAPAQGCTGRRRQRPLLQRRDVLRDARWAATDGAVIMTFETGRAEVHE